MFQVVLENVDRPDGQGGYYRFFRNAETDQTFKARHEARTAADGSPALSVSVSPVDAEGKALRDPRGEPDVLSLTHTFTTVETGDPEFDMMARVATVLAEAVRQKEEQLRLRSALVDLGSAWGGVDPLPL